MVGLCARAMSCAFIERESAQRAGLSDLVVARQNDQSTLSPPMVIFPEATTTNGQYLCRFSTGAFRSGKPVRIIALRYPSKHFCMAWESINVFVHIFRMLTQFRNYVEVIHLPTYVPSTEEKNDLNLYAENVRKFMAEKLSLRCTDHTYKDKVQFMDLVNGKISPDDIISKYEKED
eukprot:CAMPEP_0184370300 /NCGR_PEP_ID=MMETSP1089-20130417/162742_1 /TAXON_ID=38269 ORGANISM="Gloeochaete wittrockiana, Strain SAG46.84" /NCGR_SAMPLE_ID=MMETSP1089 /ASSEMBLY_ACC=CAM_ASM_000445 /LENGTH=175 /DNA_ID=CAMNT_0026712881 /DNA_START=517 /DNA_END=1044 /DNA_ORIENTATION=-